LKENEKMKKARDFLVENDDVIASFIKIMVLCGALYKNRF